MALDSRPTLPPSGPPIPIGTEALERELRRHSALWLVLLSGLAFLAVHFSTVDASRSDPAGSLLTAQALVERGTIRLDAYLHGDELPVGVLAEVSNGHAYDYFPIGAPLAATPAVWLALLRGDDMADPEDNRRLQNWLSSLTVVACGLLVYGLGRAFLSYSGAFALTALFVFGGPIASTLGTALWSSNVALICGLLVLRLVVEPDRCPTGLGRELILGGLLFFAYLCRPTMVLLFPAIVAYELHRRGRLPGTMIATVSGSMAAFVGWSWWELGQLLPPYYQPSHLGEADFSTALYAHLLSPSRGILVGSPYLLLVLVGIVAWRQLWRESLVWLGLGWLVSHWILVSSFHHWWGGWSFGNRLFVEVLPAQVLLAALVLQQAEQGLPAGGRRRWLALGLATGLFSVFLHSYQALYNPWTMAWNEGIDKDPVRVLDWSRPQFLASPRQVLGGQRASQYDRLRPLQPGDVVLPTSTDAFFEGFSVPEGNGHWRWSDRETAVIVVRAGERLLAAGGLVMEIEAGTYGAQVIDVLVNGIPSGTVRSDRNWEPSVYALSLAPEVLAAGETPRPDLHLVEIELRIPNAVWVGDGPRLRRLGLCFRRLVFRPGS